MVGLDSPGQLIVLCDSINHARSDFADVYRVRLEIWLSSIRPGPSHREYRGSLQDFEEFIQRWPQDSLCQSQATIRHLYIPRLKAVLQQHEMGVYPLSHYWPDTRLIQHRQILEHRSFQVDRGALSPRIWSPYLRTRMLANSGVLLYQRGNSPIAWLNQA
jgi:hypothetical protein